jgi:hypothetical protein
MILKSARYKAEHRLRLAVREIQPGRHLVVVYREGAADGFIITAFITSKTATLERRKQLWP